MVRDVESQVPRDVPGRVCDRINGDRINGMVIGSMGD